MYIHCLTYAFYIVNWNSFLFCVLEVFEKYSGLWYLSFVICHVIQDNSRFVLSVIACYLIMAVHFISSGWNLTNLGIFYWLYVAHIPIVACCVHYITWYELLLCLFSTSMLYSLALPHDSMYNVVFLVWFTMLCKNSFLLLCS